MTYQIKRAVSLLLVKTSFGTVTTNFRKKLQETNSLYMRIEE